MRSPILRVAQIDVPVLLIHGDRDENVPVAQTTGHGRGAQEPRQGRRDLHRAGRHALLHRAAERRWPGVSCSTSCVVISIGARSFMRVSEAVNSRHSMRVFKPDPVPQGRHRMDHRQRHAARRRTATCSRGSSTSPMGKARQRLSAAILKAMDDGDNGPGGEYDVYPEGIHAGLRRPPQAGRQAALHPARRAARRRRRHAEAVPQELRLLRRAGRHDPVRRAPHGRRPVDRLRHLPRPAHAAGAREGPAHLPAGRLQPLPARRAPRARKSPTTRS